MKDNIVEQIKEKRKVIDSSDKKINSNNKIIEELKKDKKVLKCLMLLEENKKMQNSINNISNDINSLICNNCNHNLFLYKEYNIGMYDSYYKYQCIECGEVIESSYRLNNVIFSDISFEILKNDYYDYLLKYDGINAIDIMKYIYNGSLFNELLENGVEPIRALNLVKKTVIGKE